MADTAKLGITKIEASQSQKEVTANAAFDKFDKAIAGYADIDISGGAGNQTLDAGDQLNSAMVLSGTITGNRNVIVSLGKKWHFYNGTSGAYTVTVKTSGGTGVEIPAGEWREVLNDGTNIVEIGGGSGGGGGGTWGGITGTLSDQTDLQSALDGKADDGDIPTDLTDLGDFPASYTGHGGKLLRVKTGEDGVEFVPPSVQAAIMSQVVGDGTEDTFAIEHGFGSLDVIVIVREATDSGADGYIRIDTGYEVRYYDSNTVQVIFDSPPSAGQYIVTCALPWIQADVPVASPGSSTYATPGEYEFVVPPGVDEITGKMWGAGGGGATNGTVTTSGGGGGFAEATLSVTAGEVLTVHVGAGGTGYTHTNDDAAGGAAGGGLTGIFRGGTALLIAGSGGGGGISASTVSTDSADGGHGGGTTGGDGEALVVSTDRSGDGGTQSAGGAAGTGGNAGSALTGGAPDPSLSTYDAYGGGGGAGYYGGGGGAGLGSGGSANGTDAGAGAGGSGYVSGSSTTLTAGSGATAANTGDGEYVTGVGAGGSGGTNGGPGWVKLSWS